MTFTATPPTSAGYLTGNTQTGSTQPSLAITVYRPLLEQLRGFPGVKDAALASSIPFDGVDMRTSFDLNGKSNTTQEGKEHWHAWIRVTSGSYMKAMRTAVVRGRAISDEHTEDRPYVAVVNQAFAHEFSPLGANPIGQPIDLGGKDTGMVKPYKLVGVVADAAQKSASEPAIRFSLRLRPSTCN